MIKLNLVEVQANWQLVETTKFPQTYQGLVLSTKFGDKLRVRHTSKGVTSQCWLGIELHQQYAVGESIKGFTVNRYEWCGPDSEEPECTEMLRAEWD